MALLETNSKAIALLQLELFATYRLPNVQYVSSEGGYGQVTARAILLPSRPYVPPGSSGLLASLQTLTLKGITGNENKFKMVDEMYVCFPDLGEYMLILSFSS